MIQFFEKENKFVLSTENTSYIFRILPNGTPEHIYYGAKAAGENSGLLQHTYAVSSFSPRLMLGDSDASLDNLNQEYSAFGTGDFRSPAISVETACGVRVNLLKYKGHRIISGKPALSGLPHTVAVSDSTQTLEIELSDDVCGFSAKLSYSVFEEENIIARSVTVRNESNSPVRLLKAASASVDFDVSNFDMVSLSGAWARERHIERYPLHHGTTSIESRRGASGHQLNPFAALAERNADENSGGVYGFALVYSGDFKISAELSQLGSVRLMLGINPETFSWKLEPGESFITPEALLTYSSSGFNGMSHNFHNICRNCLGASSKNLKHPIVINNWEAMYFSLNEEKILKFIDDCKGLGIDTFVMDDGWFGHRDSDDSSLGDWFIDRNKFPNGFEPIVRRCRENGMRFGIWFEPEMISRDSELFGAHPDWCIHSPGREPVESRNQLVLDMSRAEVRDNIYAQVADILGKYDISYVKWDMNRNITDNGSQSLSADRQSEHSHRYILGVYELMERLTGDFPNVFFEGCSGGGGRFDFGMLYYMPQIWTSDDTDALERLYIQYGTSYVYPPSSMVAHISAVPNHQTGRITPFHTRGEVAQMCNYGYELDIGKLPDSEKQQISGQVKKHRDIDGLVQNGDFYRLKNPFAGNECSWELVSQDKSRAYVMFAFKSAVPNPETVRLHLKGLAPNTEYFVDELGCSFSGDTLMNIGLPITERHGDYEAFSFNIYTKDR